MYKSHLQRTCKLSLPNPMPTSNSPLNPKYSAPAHTPLHSPTYGSYHSKDTHWFLAGDKRRCSQGEGPAVREVSKVGLFQCPAHQTSHKTVSCAALCVVGALRRLGLQQILHRHQHCQSHLDRRAEADNPIQCQGCYHFWIHLLCCGSVAQTQSCAKCLYSSYHAYGCTNLAVCISRLSLPLSRVPDSASIRSCSGTDHHLPTVGCSLSSSLLVSAPQSPPLQCGGPQLQHFPSALQ